MAPIEYQRITDRVGVIPLRTNVGVIHSGSDCVLIDTGIDEEVGKRILKVTSSMGLSVKAIVNTHSHSDHYGGNSFIVEKSGARVFAPGGEAWVIENPWLEAAYFSQGAAPLPQLLNKFVVGPPCKVNQLISSGPFEAGGMELEAVPLPGHSFAMTGVGADGVLFCGDSLFGEDTIAKHHVLFLHDPDTTRESLRRIAGLPHGWFVPSHGQPVGRSEVGALVARNIAAIDSFDECILKSVKGPIALSALASRALVAAGVQTADETRVALMQSTARAHITSLARAGKLMVAPGAPGTGFECDLVCTLPGVP